MRQRGYTQFGALAALPLIVRCGSADSGARCMKDTDGVHAAVLYEVELDERHRPTDNTLHVSGDQAMIPPTALRIVRYAGDPGFYLLYLDAAGDEMTDTWHRTLDDAMHQAEVEFSVAPADWQTVTEPL